MENTAHYYRACTVVLVLILNRQQFFKKMATWKWNVCVVELPASCNVLFVIVRWCHKRRQSATDNERWKSWLVGALCTLQAWTDVISRVSNCLIWHSDVHNRYKYLLWTYFLCSLESDMRSCRQYFYEHYTKHLWSSKTTFQTCIASMQTPCVGWHW